MGIGFAVAKDICEMGGNVAVLDLRDSPLEDVHGLAKKFNVKVEYIQADVSNEASLRAAFDKAISALGRLDGIVTAAGIAIDKPFAEQGWEEVNKVIQINVSFSNVVPGSELWLICYRALDHSSPLSTQSNRCRNKAHQEV